jgi:hypothetical protein
VSVHIAIGSVEKWSCLTTLIPGRKKLGQETLWKVSTFPLGDDWGERAFVGHWRRHDDQI